MHELVNFSSLLELMAALNLLLVLLEVFPIYDALEREADALDGPHNEKQRDVARSNYLFSRVTLVLLSLVGTGASVGLLIWSSFDPTASLSAGWMAILLVYSFIVVPISSLPYLFYLRSRLELHRFSLEDH